MAFFGTPCMFIVYAEYLAARMMSFGRTSRLSASTVQIALIANGLLSSMCKVSFKALFLFLVTLQYCNIRHPDQFLVDGVLLPWPGCETAWILHRLPDQPSPPSVLQGKILWWAVGEKCCSRDLVWQGWSDQLQDVHSGCRKCSRHHN